MSAFGGKADIPDPMSDDLNDADGRTNNRLSAFRLRGWNSPIRPGAFLFLLF